MLRFLWINIFVFIVTLTATTQSYRKITGGIQIKVEDVCVEIEFYSPSTIRVCKYPGEVKPEKNSFSVIKQPGIVPYKVKRKGNLLQLVNKQLTVSVDLATGNIRFADKNNKPLFTEKTGGSSFVYVNDAENDTYKVRQAFTLDKDEIIYGLGQHQEGKMNQRNQEILLVQQNTQISIPIIHSVKGYAVFWDNYSPTTFADNEGGMSFESSAGDCIDYYFMYGGNADKVIGEIRNLTGQVPMLPLWTYGFWQSKERYTSQQEIIGVVEKYRSQGIPLDGIIQDWQYWSTDNNYWNDMKFGNPEFPDPKGMIDKIHDLNAHIMVSVWPSFGPESEPFRIFKEKGMLMDFTTYPNNVPARVYDPFNSEARDIYWELLNKNIFSLGMDAWWLDATEPEHLDIKEQDFDYQTPLGSFRKVRNAFPLVTAGGIYDHQREASLGKRVFILTRSAFAGQQRYGANSWSGDVYSNWTTLRNQISAGLNLSLTGIPYWNSDIGGFWSYADYPKGINDPAYHELYVRWLQFGTFTPMMRSHGSNTPREIFNFGEKGDWAYDVQEKYIRLRYRLLPYIYSTSWDVTNNSGSMMRALFMDFIKDTNVYDINNEYLFGRSLLVTPVTDSLYVSRASGEAMVDFSKVKTQEVYLPAGTKWYDFWTDEQFNGGQIVTREVPIDIIPLYVKAGTILPIGPSVQYAEEKKWDDLEIRIYPGQDGHFMLYEDENNNYCYENGVYSIIQFEWNEKKHELAIGQQKGSFPGMPDNRKFRILLIKDDTLNSDSTKGKENLKEILYHGESMRVVFNIN